MGKGVGKYKSLNQQMNGLDKVEGSSSASSHILIFASHRYLNFFVFHCCTF